MPGRVKTAVVCLAFALAYSAGPSAASGEDAAPDAGTASGPQPAQSGKTVQTELEYLTSRQSADARKAQKAAPTAAVSATVATTAPATPAQRAARASRPTVTTTVSAPVEKGPMRMEEVPVAGERAERSTANRNRRNVHHAPTWSLSFFFSGLREAIVSSRVQYLPLLGSAPVRFTQTREFDRTNLMGLRQFDERMGEVSISTAGPEKAKKASTSAPDAGAAVSASPAENVAHPAADDTVRMGAKATVSGTTVGGTVAVSSGVVPGATPASASAQNVDYTPVNSEVVLKYFDKNGQSAPGNANGAAGAQAQVRVGMPFVMPYQNEQPLIMDSSATYRQTDDAAQSGTSAK